MKFDWKIILILVAAIITVIVIKTQTENLEGDPDAGEETEETEETEKPMFPYPEVPAFVASLNANGGRIKFMDLARIDGMLENTKVMDDPQTYTYCKTSCNQDVLNDPERKDEHKQCKTDCDKYLTGICNGLCVSQPDAPECDTICKDYLE